jgi:hypothetical protein
MLPVFESCTEGAIDAFEMFEFNVNTLLKIVPETVRPVRVPTLVIFACAFPVTAPAVGIVPVIVLEKIKLDTFNVVAFIVVANTFVVWRAFDE